MPLSTTNCLEIIVDISNSMDLVQGCVVIFQHFDELSLLKELLVCHVALEVYYITLEQHLPTNIYCETSL